MLLFDLRTVGNRLLLFRKRLGMTPSGGVGSGGTVRPDLRGH